MYCECTYMDCPYNVTLMGSVGLLLGLAATHQGSLTESVAKLLSIHVPALHPPASTDLEVTTLLGFTLHLPHPSSFFRDSLFGSRILQEHT